MRLLFIGGTGVISSAISKMVLQQEHELYILNRSGCKELEDYGAKHIKGNIREKEEIYNSLKNMTFDVVVDFICFTLEDAKIDYELFKNITGQFIFISSASAYDRFTSFNIITESTPLRNPFWEYSRNKITCEDFFIKCYRDTNFPVTIIRPSHTYGKDKLPVAISGANTSWTYIDMILKGKKMVVHGDGTSLWTITHNTDFALGFCGLLGRKDCLGHTFHITSDECIRWNDIMNEIYYALGKEPNYIHISSEFITDVYPDYKGPLIGDKTESSVFDNWKIKNFVPDFKIKTRLSEGVREVIDYINEHKELQVVDNEYVNKIKYLIEQYN